MTRTLTLMLTGVLSGILAFAGVEMLLRRDLPGDTPSPELGVLLMAGALVVALTGIGVALALPWSGWLRPVVGLACLVLGFGGLLFLLVATLMVSGAFPNTLLQPLNLSIGLVMAVSGFAGAGLLMPDFGKATIVGSGSWLARSWHPVTAGILTGAAAAWFWGAFAWPLIPHECCFL